MPHEKSIARVKPLSLNKYVFTCIDKYLSDKPNKTQLSVLCFGALYREAYLNDWLTKKSAEGKLDIYIHTLADKELNSHFEKKGYFRTRITKEGRWSKLANIHESHETINIDKELPDSGEYDVIINFHLLHNSINWRLLTIRLLSKLADGGVFVFTEIGGTYSILDGNFKNMPKDMPVYTLMKSFDRHRNNHHHYWRPELSLTNYTELKNQVEFLFDEVIDKESASFGIVDMDEVTIDSIELEESYTFQHLFEEAAFSYFRIGLDKQSRDIWSNPIYKEVLSKHLCEVLQRKDQLYVCRSFNKNKFDKIKERHWNYNALMKDLDYIKDNEIQSLGRKVIDLFASHDLFFPGYTKYLCLVPWVYENTSQWSYPLQLLHESNFRDNGGHPVADNLFRILLLTQKTEDNFLKLLFKQSEGKSPLYIAVWTDVDFQEAGKKGYVVVEDNSAKGKMAYMVEYTRKNNIGQISIAINAYIVDQIVADNEGFIKWFKQQCPNAAPPSEQNQPAKEDSEELRADILTRLRIDERTMKNYFSALGAEEFPAINVFALEMKGIEKLKSDFKKSVSRMETRRDSDEQILDRIITLTVLFQLREESYRVGYIPSSIIKNKSSEHDEWSYNGLGGIILYEKLPGADNPILASLVAARDRALREAVNLIFYKASIASFVHMDVQKRALISAVAAITARSGAHTLGSHVLPEVSSQLSEMALNGSLAHDPLSLFVSIQNAYRGEEIPETDKNVKDFKTTVRQLQKNNKYLIHDRELFKYLQERFDFIAQFASDLPQWSLPLNFVGDVLKNFYRQYHILNGLGDTEGIRAYKYTNEQDEKDWFENEAISEIVQGQFVSVYSHCTVVEKKLCFVATKNDGESIRANPALLEKDEIEAFVCEGDVMDENNTPLNEIIEEGFAEDGGGFRGQKLKMTGKVRQAGQKVIRMTDCKIGGGQLVIKARIRKYVHFEDNRYQSCLSYSTWLSSSKEDLLNVARPDPKKLAEEPKKFKSFWGVIKKIEKPADTNSHRYRISLFYSRGTIYFEMEEAEFNKITRSFENYYKNSEGPKPKKELFSIGARVILKGSIEDRGDSNYEIVPEKEKQPVEIKEVSLIDYITTTSTVEKDIYNEYKDLQIAIPGGVVGTQAFYIILENIIRNTAKHNWINLKRFYKAGKNLEIKVELEDHHGHDYYVCKIWSNSTDLRYMDVIPYQGDRNDSFLTDPNLLTVNINKCLEKRIVEEDGSFDRENLGLSEMKICAAFLAKNNWVEKASLSGQSIFLSDTKGMPSKGFIRCSMILEEDAGELVPRLGYRIKLLKLKEIVAIGKERKEIPSEAKHDITFLKEKNENESLDYEYCILWDSGQPPRLYKVIENFVDHILEKKEGDTTEMMEELSSMIEEYPCRLFMIIDPAQRNKVINALWEGFIKNFNELVKQLELNEKDTRYLLFIRKRIYFIDIIPMGKNIFRDGRGVIDVHDTSWFRELLYDKWPRLFSLKQCSYELVIGNLLINGQDGSAPVETVPLNLRSARPQAIQQSNGQENRSVIIFRHNEKKKFYINYKRHDNRRIEDDIYNDRVSGSSKLYSVLRNYAVESDEIQKARIRAKLIESGLTTIMILDERVFNYVLRDRDMERVSGNTGLYNSYQRLNIVVPYKLCINGEVKYQAREESVESIDGYKRRILLLEKDRSVDIYFKQPQNTIADVGGDQYNINSIVIHQTILDYMAKGLFPEDHLNTVGHHSGDKVIFKLKHESNIPCIIITSGRGRLHNSSRFAKFIPFANISDLLLRTDPDKYTLTQTLLQSLNLPDESKK